MIRKLKRPVFAAAVAVFAGLGMLPVAANASTTSFQGAICAIRIPAGTRGKRLVGSITVTADRIRVSKAFGFTIG